MTVREMIWNARTSTLSTYTGLKNGATLRLPVSLILHTC